MLAGISILVCVQNDIFEEALTFLLMRNLATFDFTKQS